MKFLLDHDVPDDVGFSLAVLNHEALKVREVLHGAATDKEVFDLAIERDCVLITCNRDDFLAIVRERTSHSGLIILIRRRSRALERAALIRLIDRAGESGLRGNVNFA